MDPFTASIIMSIALILGALTSSYLADILGRRRLNLITMMLSACGLLATALFHYLNVNGYDLETLTWIPVCTISFVVYISSAGIVPLSVICSVEYLPTKVCTEVEL